MLLLLGFALVSLSLATIAVIRFPLPASGFGRALLVSWFVGVTAFILLMGWDL